MNNLNLYKEWGLISFTCNSNDSKRIVYISFKKGNINSLQNRVCKNTSVKYVPCMYNNKQLVVLNESSIV